MMSQEWPRNEKIIVQVPMNSHDPKACTKGAYRTFYSVSLRNAGKVFAMFLRQIPVGQWILLI